MGNEMSEITKGMEEEAQKIRREVAARTQKLFRESQIIICTRCHKFAYIALQTLIEGCNCQCENPDRVHIFLRPDLCKFYSVKERSAYDRDIEVTEADHKQADAMRALYQPDSDDAGIGGMGAPEGSVIVNHEVGGHPGQSEDVNVNPIIMGPKPDPPYKHKYLHGTSTSGEGGLTVGTPAPDIPDIKKKEMKYWDYYGGKTHDDDKGDKPKDDDS